MIQHLRFFLVITAIAVITGCAGPGPKIDIPPRTLANVHTIAVIRSPEPKAYTAVNFGHPGMMFGLVGGLVVAADQNHKQSLLTEAIKKINTVPTSDVLAEGIANQLTRRGFEVSVEDGPWEESDGKFNLDFEKITSSADAVLVVAPTIVGFVATGATKDYVPTITAVVTLLGKDRKNPIYRGFHASGWHPRGDDWRCSSPVVTTFGNFDALMSDPAKTANALSDAATGIAVTVAEDLKR